MLYSKVSKVKQGFNKLVYMEVVDNLIISDSKPEGYKPLLIATYCRTVDNRVITYRDKHGDIFAEIMSPPDLTDTFYSSYLLESGYIQSKNFLNKIIRCDDDNTLRFMVENSYCYPVGVHIDSNAIVPVMNIVLKDDVFDNPKIHVSKPYALVDIDCLSPLDNVQESIAQSLVKVDLSGGEKHD